MDRIRNCATALLASSFLWAAPLTAQTPKALPGKGEPPLSAQTMISGGIRPPEQLAVRFDSADLSFEVRPDTQELNGVAVLDFTAKAPLSRLVIDLDQNLRANTIAINGTTLGIGEWSHLDGRVIITLRRPLRRPLRTGQKVQVTITYGGTPHVAVRAPWDTGVVWAKTPDGRPWFATTDQGYGCDLLWPCLDYPMGEPGVVTLHITVPKGLKAPSNGVLLGVDTLPDGRTRWNWRAKHPNTYAISLNVGPYEVIEGKYKSRFGNTIPMFYWYLPGEKEKAQGLFDEFAPTLDFFESTVGPFPFGDEKLGVVETPHKGMEHQTINAYGNEYAKAPEGFDWLFQHEFSHEWFGNQLTNVDWDDFWLHEGYGSYMQPSYGRWREGEARYAVMMDAQRGQIANTAPIVHDRSMTEQDVYEEAKGGPGLDIYMKGSWMLHTLRNLIGDKAFWEVTRLAVYGRTDPKPGNFAPRYGSTKEYEGFVRQVTGKDYGWFFNVYLRQAALPEIVETRVGDRLTLTWKVPGGGPFPLPVEVQVGDTVQTLPMTDGTGTLTVPADAHVVVDPWSKILKHSVAIEQFRAWKAEQAAKRKKRD